jgi:hypothetical protein
MSLRSELEREVRIIAREQKAITFLEKPVAIRGIPWETMEEIGGLLVSMFSPFFEFAAHRIGAGAESSGSEFLSADDSITPGMIMQVGSAAGEAIRKLIEFGSDAEWDFVKQADFSVVIELAFEILKYNFGPELRKNLQGGVIGIIEALMPTRIPPEVVSILSNPSSSEPVTESKT